MRVSQNFLFNSHLFQIQNITLIFLTVKEINDTQILREGTHKMTSLLNKLQEIGNSIIALNNTRAGVSLNNLSAAGEAKLASLTSELVTKDEISTVGLTGSYNDLVDKPEDYVLPTATIDTLGAVKPDGTTITITEGGTISANVPEIDTSNLVTKDEVYTKTEIDSMIGDIESLLQEI